MTNCGLCESADCEKRRVVATEQPLCVIQRVNEIIATQRGGITKPLSPNMARVMRAEALKTLNN
jgi:hypothetical protein